MRVENILFVVPRKLLARVAETSQDDVRVHFLVDFYDLLFGAALAYTDILVAVVSQIT